MFPDGRPPTILVLWKKKELRTPGTFEKTLGEEVSVFAEFDLPLTVLIVNVKGGWQEGDVRRALDTLRAADLIAQPEELEVLSAMPNTAAAGARVMEERLAERSRKPPVASRPTKGAIRPGTRSNAPAAAP